MKSLAEDKDVLDELAKLDAHQKPRVLNYFRTLANALPPGTPGPKMIQFAGLIPRDDLMIMKQAIEEGCERINADEW